MMQSLKQKTDDALIVARNLSKTVYTASDTLTILTGVSLSLRVGESLAIIGESGSGKSTLLSLLAGLDVATSGEVYLDGQNLAILNEDERALLRRRMIGFVFQSFYLLPHLNALENVMLPLELCGHPQARQIASDFLARLGLQARLKHLPRQLSGGEQQRVALARAFVNRPALLFADEPTGNLDSHTGEQVMDLLFELNREQQTALVLVTHDAVLAARCQQTIRLRSGSLL